MVDHIILPTYANKALYMESPVSKDTLSYNYDELEATSHLSMTHHTE